MDPREVIVVDNSPPSSPVPETNTVNNSSNELDLSSMNETLSWSTFTAKFISSTMNSVVLNSDELAPDTGYNTMNVATYNSSTHAMTADDGYLKVAKTNFPRQYRSPFSQYKPDNSQYNNSYPKPPYYRNYTHSIEVTNSYSYYPVNKNNNTMLPADMMRQTKTDSFYYFDGRSQTPMRLANYERNMPDFTEYPDITISPAASSHKERQQVQVLEPEFVDVNAYVNYSSSTNINLPSNVRYGASNQPTLFNMEKQRKTMNCTTPFLNENRTVTITKMINGEPSTNVISSIKKVANNVAEDSDDSDIIFVGEYKTEVQVPEIFLSNNSQVQDNNVNNRCDIKLEICPLEESDQNIEQSKPALRRNPKRQVQCLKKKSVISTDEFLETSKNKLKAKKVGNKTNNKRNTTAEKHLRRSLRTRLNCGAVYCPPSPISTKHFREWPVEGMHERPEYNPITNTIEPFDSHIRNISSTKPNGVNHPTSSNVQDNNDDVTLAQLCHEMLHHVFAYVATVKALQHQADEEEILRGVSDTHTKMSFLTNLALEKAVSFDERVWNVLKDTVQDINKQPAGTDAKWTELRELIENSIMLYCFTNNVSRSNVSKYIANMNPTDIIQLSNEKFGFSQ